MFFGKEQSLVLKLSTKSAQSDQPSSRFLYPCLDVPCVRQLCTYNHVFVCLVLFLSENREAWQGETSQHTCVSFPGPLAQHTSRQTQPTLGHQHSVGPGWHTRVRDVWTSDHARGIGQVQRIEPGVHARGVTWASKCSHSYWQGNAGSRTGGGRGRKQQLLKVNNTKFFSTGQFHS